MIHTPHLHTVIENVFSFQTHIGKAIVTFHDIYSRSHNLEKKTISTNLLCGCCNRPRTDEQTQTKTHNNNSNFAFGVARQLAHILHNSLRSWCGLGCGSAGPRTYMCYPEQPYTQTHKTKLSLLETWRVLISCLWQINTIITFERGVCVCDCFSWKVYIADSRRMMGTRSCFVLVVSLIYELGLK